MSLKQATRVPIPPPPDRAEPPEVQPETASGGAVLVEWLKHFALYLGAVTLAGLVGVYFFWKIAALWNPAQLLNLAEEPRTARVPATTAVSASSTRVIPAPSSPAVDTAASSPPVATDASATATPPPTVATEPVTAPASEAPATAATPADPAAAPPADPTAPPADPATATTVAVAPPTNPATPTPPLAEPPAEAAPPPPTPQAEIERLLTEAQQQIENRRFTAPASGNALSTYRRILELQPDHPAALDGLQRITTYYREVAQKSLQQGRLDESLAYANRGLRASPQNNALLNLRQQVQKAKRRQQEAQRQAALEEARRQQLEQQVQMMEQRPEQEPQQPWWRQPSNPADNSGFNQR